MIRCDFFSTRRYLLILAVAAVAVGITLLVARERIERVYVHLELSHCLIYLNTDARSECAFGVIRTVLVTQGVSAAMDAFITTYRMLPAGSLGADCHNAVHRVGDMAYFNVYMNDPDLSNLAYPETTLICGAGFFHGFFEHMIQDRPNPTYLLKVWKYFSSQPESYLKNMVTISCFHAAGHGLIRAQTELVQRREFGNLASFVDTPVATCNSLPGITDQQKYACITGVMSIFVQMYTSHTYGFFVSNVPDTLDPCGTFPAKLRAPCYNMRSLGLMQHGSDYMHIMRLCTELRGDEFTSCIDGMVEGVSTNGWTSQAFSTAVKICSEPEVKKREYAIQCYGDISKGIRFDYSIVDPTPRCPDLPEDYRAACEQNQRVRTTE